MGFNKALPRAQIVGAVLVTAYSIGVHAAPYSEEDDLALVYGSKATVSIATGSRQALRRAPSVASVITAEDIAAIGATDLDQVLETVPGLHVTRGTQTNMPVYVIRGVHRDANSQVLMLVNGVPVTTAFQGNQGNVWGGLPLENVARVEVIRGPGSALYGADAFSGVINIITKSSAEIGGTQTGLRFGTFNAKDAWVQHGGHWGPIDVAAYVRVGSTDGYKKTVAADAQTGLDSLTGTHVSRAPGDTNNGRDSVDGTVDLAYDKLQFRVGYKERSHVGSGTGIASALDPSGQSYSERLTSDLTYRDANFAKNWDVNIQASYMRYKEYSDLVLFPAGSNLGGGVFTDGMIGNPYKWERHGRVNASAFYSGFDLHRTHFGAGYVKQDLYKVFESKNFQPGVFPYTPIGTGSILDITNVSDTAPFLRPHQRTTRFWFVQDEWNLAKDWTLTAGVRHDAYSDFGGTTNPRLAIVWDAAYNLTAKLLYGAAFRAPSFVELYNINNPVLTGTASLVPEKMRTGEAALNWQAAADLLLSVNVFQYRMRDAIQPVGTTYQNTGKQTGKGVELEAAWDVTREIRLDANFSQQRSIDEAAQQDSGLAPHNHVYLRSDWRFLPEWAVNAQLNAVGTRQRAPGDTRAPLAGYNTVDLTLRSDMKTAGWDFAASVRNLFNADAREPSPFGTPFISLPNDFPLAGRSFYLQTNYWL